MASRPNPSWSGPQKWVFKDIQEAMEIVVPYFGPEIPVLDNNTPEQICDMLGVVKIAKKAVEQVEKTLIARFKPLMPACAAGSEGSELRSGRFVATLRVNDRTALNQQAVKEDLLERADELGVNLERLLDWIQDMNKTQRDLPGFKKFVLEEDESNVRDYFSTTGVETLTVKAI